MAALTPFAISKNSAFTRVSSEDGLGKRPRESGFAETVAYPSISNFVGLPVPALPAINNACPVNPGSEVTRYDRIARAFLTALCEAKLEKQVFSSTKWSYSYCPFYCEATKDTPGQFRGAYNAVRADLIEAKVVYFDRRSRQDCVLSDGIKVAYNRGWLTGDQLNAFLGKVESDTRRSNVRD